MRNTNGTQISRIVRLGSLGALSVVTLGGSLLITGCAGFNAVTSAPAKTVGQALQGRVFGGQQPVSGSTMQLYAANTTGYGALSYPLLTTAVTTGTDGSFSITGDYICPSSTSQVYIVATGGVAGGYSANPAIALMAGLGACGNLTPATALQINEVTTVVTAYALAPFMSSYLQAGTSASNVTGLANAFGSVNKLVNISTGAMPGTTLPAGATIPTAELNTLGNILASCINSAGGSSSCSTLFTNATAQGGTTPADTITAILNIAKNPGSNVTNLYNVASGTPPFQPGLAAAPTDFTVAIKYAAAGTFSAPSAAAVDASGNLWVTNSGTHSIAILNATTGAATFTTGGNLNAPSAIAFEANGNAWVPNQGSSSLSTFTPAGVGQLSTVTGLSMPTSIAVDGQNNLWITSAGNNSVESVILATSGTTASSFSTYMTAGVNAPVAVAINPH